jgi:hypothetical protein
MCQIFVELERASLTRTLAKLMEAQGKLKEAARVLQEVQVETLGKMEKIDKIDYILEQIRLCLDSQDFLRANILSRKINTTALQAKDCQVWQAITGLVLVVVVVVAINTELDTDYHMTRIIVGVEIAFLHIDDSILCS